MSTADILRRLASLENERKAPRAEAVYSRLKCATAFTKGDIYVLTTTAQLIETTNEEGNESRVVVAAESKTDSVGVVTNTVDSKADSTATLNSTQYSTIISKLNSLPSA